MNAGTIQIRLMKADDFDAVVGIDKKVLQAPRMEYYRLKFEKLFQSKNYLPASLVAEEKAALDTIGVNPTYQSKGIGKQLIDEFIDHLRTLGVQKINTLVDWNDSKLIHFFSANQFSPSKTINLERCL